MPKAKRKVAARVKLPSRYTARQLVTVARWFRANPDGVGCVFDELGNVDHAYTAAEWFAWFAGRLAAKVNARDPRFPAGRKAGDEYQRACRRVADQVRSRLIVRPRDVAPLGAKAAARLAARVTQPWEE